MRYDNSVKDKVFDAINILIMLIVIFITLYPFWFAIVGSFNEGADYMRGGVNFWPRKFSLDNYAVVFADSTVIDAYKVTILRTIIGTITHVLFTALFAYGFTRKNLIGRNLYAAVGIITMFFGGGLIPYYFLLKALGLINNFLVYIIPTMFSFWDVLIFQAFFREIPESILESARIDGASEYRIFFKLVIPLSMPVLAAITLFTAVGHWNSFFDSMVFTSSPKLQTIQLYLMKVVRTKEAAINMASRAAEKLSEDSRVNSTTVQLATMVVTSAPIIVIYPFLQKYFVKGVMIGSIKG